MSAMKFSFYEFPDLIRGIDILFGVMASFGIKFLWDNRSKFKQITGWQFTVGFFIFMQGFVLTMYLLGTTHTSLLITIELSSIAILLSESPILDRIIKKTFVKITNKTPF